VPLAYSYQPPPSRAHTRDYKGVQEWQTNMCGAPCAEPAAFCGGFWCPCCFIYMQREQLLMGDFKHYVCCAGLCGPKCTECTEGCVRDREQCCLVMEVIFCMTCALNGNRWMVRQHYNLVPDCCDTFLVYLSCFCRILALVTRMHVIEYVSDLIFHLLVGCMIAQHTHQMKVQGYPQGCFAAPPQMT